VRKVVHFSHFGYEGVKKVFKFQVFAPYDKIISLFFIGLTICSKIEQINETGRKQGKNRAPEIFSAKLSTRSGDRFSLALGSASLQQGLRIGGFESGLLP
jgi:hypothetical protein